MEWAPSSYEMFKQFSAYIPFSAAGTVPIQLLIIIIIIIMHDGLVAEDTLSNNCSLSHLSVVLQLSPFTLM